MAMDGDDAPGVVLVAARGDVALGEPRFILKVGEKYFLTFGAWEYDIAQAKTPRQERGCKEIAELFAGSPKVEAAHLRHPDEHDLGRGTAIKPKPNTAIKPPRRRKGGEGDRGENGAPSPNSPSTPDRPADVG